MSEEVRAAELISLNEDNIDKYTEYLTEYESRIRIDGVAVSKVSLPARTSSKEKAILKARGFIIGLMEGDNICATVSEIEDIAAFKKIKVSDAVKPLKAITQRGFRTAVSRMTEQGRYGICQDLSYLPRTFFENDVSCYAEDNGQINGMLLFHLTPSDKLKVMVMTAEGKGSALLLPQMIKKAILCQAAMIPRRSLMNSRIRLR